MVPGPDAMAIILAGNPVGALEFGAARADKRTPDKDVMAVLARIMEMVRLRLELAAALREVEASRSRILAAGYAERQRLERDLHDGAQQRLVVLGMTLRLAQRHLGGDQQQLSGVLDAAVAELGTAVAELRQLAHGLRPSSLDAGLAAALEHLRNTAPVAVDLDLSRAEHPGAPIPELVGTTAYFIASEAVANAAKHAQAHKVGIALVHDGSMISIGVTDDGVGGALVRAGGGLAGLLDRVSAQGGTLRVVSAAGHGTLVEARLPCG